jgi:formylmethanofuran dehydrogenase subunit E
MIKRIETFLANIFRREILPVKSDITAALAAITKMRGELAELHARFEESKTHATNVAAELHESITGHTTEVASELHAKIAADAKAIAQFQRNVRMACSWCGQMTYEFAVKGESRKILCADCQKKGRS